MVKRFCIILASILLFCSSAQAVHFTKVENSLNLSYGGFFSYIAGPKIGPNFRTGTELSLYRIKGQRWARVYGVFCDVSYKYGRDGHNLMLSLGPEFALLMAGFDGGLLFNFDGKAKLGGTLRFFFFIPHLQYYLMGKGGKSLLMPYYRINVLSDGIVMHEVGLLYKYKHKLK